jgi:hypothetical protein
MPLSSLLPAEVSEHPPARSLSPGAEPLSSTFEQRWNAWVARGHVHDRAVQGQLIRTAIGAVAGLTIVAAAWPFMDVAR